MEYAARIHREGKHWLAEFPELPGCSTFAESREALAQEARDALEGWLQSELKARRVPPRPKRHRGTEWLSVRIDPTLAAKIGLRQAREAAGLSQSDVARLLGVTQQAIAKLEDPDRTAELSTVARAAEALGCVLALDILPA
jgi:predicted RNase H-like HicB family nuclease/DNA-binding XRE family transcriptional regulator